MSRCNPPCGEGEQCTAAGECELREPVPTPSTVVDAPREEVALTPERSGFVAIPRVAFLVSGAGDLHHDFDCSPGAGCASDASAFEFDDQSLLMLEVSVLYQLLSELRLGLGALVVPSKRVELSGGVDDSRMGTELSPLLVAEGVFGSELAGVVRGFAGLNLLFPNGALENASDELDAMCGGLREAPGVSCELHSGPFLGWTAGVGIGLLRELNAFGVRADLVLQYAATPGPSFEASDAAGESVREALSLSGTRFWLGGGVEF